MRHLCISATLGGLLAAGSVSLLFEQTPQELFAGRSPKFLARGAHGLTLLSVRPAEGGKGQDLYVQSSSDNGDSFAEPVRVNQVAGEVTDHGENSPLLAASPDGQHLYVAWAGRDIRFGRSAAMRPSFSPAVTVNDDTLPVSHSFHAMGVGPDGTIYIAWLDGRDASSTHPGPHHPPISALYLARSTDQGKTFGKNARVAGDICPCCRPSIAFAGDRVLVSWRSVEPGDIRDIFLAASDDRGLTWSKPALVARDGWKITGCPHVGPALASLGSKLYAAWFTEGSGDPAIHLAVSDDAGKTFSGKRQVSGETLDPTHPLLVSNHEKLALVFQARAAGRDQGWGRVGVYYREIYSDGSLSPLARAGEGKLNANYPTVALGMSGRIYLGWTQSSQGASTAMMARGRAK